MLKKMNTKEREEALKIMNKMLETAHEEFNRLECEHFVKFKIIGRELYIGDWAFGEEFVVNEWPEFEDIRKERNDTTKKQ